MGNTMGTGKIVLLAAGCSSRLGRPKQLLPFLGMTLIEYAIEQARKASIGEVIVILGAHYEEIEAQVDITLCTLLHNPDWEEGIASSIRCALHYLVGRKENNQGAVFMVCDQPYVTSFLLTQLWTELLNGTETMVACKYEGRLGTPAAFAASHFHELLKLEGDRGAGKYLNDHKEQVHAVPFAEGVRDIDTEEEYKVLTNGTANDH